MADQQHGLAGARRLLDALDHELAEHGMDAGERLVEHDDRRVGHQHARHLEELLLAARQLLGVVVAQVYQLHALEHGLGALDQLGVGRLAVEHGHQQVVDQRHLAEDARHLEGAADAAMGDDVRRLAGDALAGDEHVAVVGPVEAADAVHQRGLAGAVDADDAQRLAGAGPEVDARRQPTRPPKRLVRPRVSMATVIVPNLAPRMPDGRRKIVPTRITKPTICAMRLRQEHRRHLLGQAEQHAGQQRAHGIAEPAQHHDDEGDDGVFGAGERR